MMWQPTHLWAFVMFGNLTQNAVMKIYWEYRWLFPRAPCCWV